MFWKKETAFIRYIIPDIDHEDDKVKTLLDATVVQVIMLIQEMKNKGLDKYVYLEIKGIV